VKTIVIYQKQDDWILEQTDKKTGALYKLITTSKTKAFNNLIRQTTGIEKYYITIEDDDEKMATKGMPPL
jgi:hypothetical protein